MRIRSSPTECPEKAYRCAGQADTCSGRDTGQRGRRQWSARSKDSKEKKREKIVKKGKSTGNRIVFDKKNTSGSSAPQGESGQDGGKKKKKSRCPVSKLCGGCSMIDMPYEEQIRGKMDILEDLIGDYVVPEPFIRMKAPEHYRHKVTRIFAPDRKGKPASGIYREGTHEVIPVKSCLIEHIQADRIIQTIFDLLPSFRIHVYDEDMDIGLLRYVQVRAARVTKEIMVTLVMTDPILPSRNTFVRELTKRHPEITTIVINVNDRNTTMVLGNREKVIYGKGYIEDVLCGKRFRISSRSFYQVNPLMTEKLYNIAIDCAALSGKETVLDTYCGIGTIGIIAAPHARRVVGVELNAEAVADGMHNVRANHLDNIEIVQGDATAFMEEIAERMAGREGSDPAGQAGPFTAGRGGDPAESIDVIFMDPPRSGATEAFMQAACAVRPKKIVYISCSPWSLQRDLAFFAQNGYAAKKAIPVDMFPYTGGIETVCLLKPEG
ncbi:MAG: 23S rRNA (uracil(1939)-C(5))-methyltransferase RlmD [Lachnospiraceae bacterium]|nr:23S rRNA (uracil(1939)-C(5))-methyltransferase RlmD [Lachnospiraceae bacterium]